MRYDAQRCGMMPGWEHSGRRPLQIVRPLPEGWESKDTVLLCNHKSSLDGLLITGAFANMPPSMPCPNSAALCWAWKIRIVHKASLLKFPLLGTMFRLAQELPIAFEDGNGGTSPQAKPESASQLMEVSVSCMH
eukprot:Polyplicarium_translucidae@DN3398_c3_g1_i5.p1